MDTNIPIFLTASIAGVIHLIFTGIDKIHGGGGEGHGGGGGHH